MQIRKFRWDFFFQIQFLICVTVVSLLSLSLSPCLLCSDKCLPVEAIRHQLVTDQTDTISKGEIINLGSSQKHLYKYIWSRPPALLTLNYYRDSIYKVRSKALIRKCLLTSSVCQRIRTSRTFIDHNTKLAMIRIFAVFVFMRQNTWQHYTVNKAFPLINYQRHFDDKY